MTSRHYKSAIEVLRMNSGGRAVVRVLRTHGTLRRGTVYTLDPDKIVTAYVLERDA